jgi:serine protease
MQIKISTPKFLLKSVFGLFLVISLLCGFFIYSAVAQQFQVWNPPPVQAPKYVQGEIVVKFKSGVKQANIEMFNQEQGATVLETNSILRFMRLKTPAGKTVEELVAIYSKNPDIEYAEPNFIVTAYMVPNDPYYNPYQWHLDNPVYGGINMQQAWDISTGSSSVIVAVIDSGVAYEDYSIYLRAPDLAGTTFVPGYDFVNGDNHPNDDNAHGTHVTGTIAQTTNNSYGVAGVAFQTAIMPIKVLGKDGSGSDTTVANGIQFAADNGAKVINMSLGGPSPSRTLENAVKYAYNKGVTIVASAGNDGKEGIGYPAAYKECIAVGATRYDEKTTYYSNYGSEIDIVAPGGDVTVDQNGDGYGDGVFQQTFNPDTKDPTDFGFWFFQGTSMAAPHVSGVSALVIAKFGDIGPDNVRQKLQTTAEDHGAAGWDKYYGWGIVDAYKALSQPPHTVTITSGPTANPATIDSGGTANLSVTATDSLGHAIAYSWTADSPEGSFSDASAQNPTWTAPVNDTGADKVYTLTVTAKCTVDPNVKDTKSVNVTVKPEAEERLKWKFQTGERVNSSPAIGSDSTIYVGSFDYYLYAINSNGTEKWKFQTGGYVASSPAIGSDSTIYVGSFDGCIYAINPNGTEKWKFQTGGVLYYSSPAIGSDGTIYVGSDDYYFYAINSNGTEKWKFQTGSYVRSYPAIGSDGTIYVWSDDNYLYAINPDGTEKWKFQTGGGAFSIGSDGTIYVGSRDNYLYAINPDGTEKWKFQTGGDVDSSPAIGSDGTIYVGSMDNCLYAINPNGTQKWKFQGDLADSSPAIGSDGTIYVGSYHYLYAINPNGTEKWKFQAGDAVYSSPAIGSDGTIYVGSRDSYLYALNSDSMGLADSNWPKFRHDNQNTGRAPICCPVKNITAMDAQAEKGQTGDVRVVIDNPSNVADIQLKLKYEASRLEYQSHTIGPLFAAWNPQVEVSPGIVSLVASGAPLSQTTEADIITITFKAIEVPYDRVPLLLEDVYLYDGDGNLLPVQTHDGEFIIKPLIGDVSGNGVVTAYDASLILQFVVGLIDQFPVELSPIPGAQQSYSIAVPHLTINAGGRIQAPININDMSGITVGGLVLRYDSNILRAVNVSASEMLSGYYWQSNVERAGEVRIAFAGGSTLSGSGALFYVEFETLPNNDGKTSPLVLDIVQLSKQNNIAKINGSITILPSRSMLLQNYPNPFNPVTWIPYLLAEPSDVTVKIYSEAGQLVRTLSLGYRSAGVYTSQGQAAYWDGKDEHGESIASGVYFYCLKAGKFTATRKMVIVK